jgi:hypothetical protein
LLFALLADNPLLGLDDELRFCKSLYITGMAAPAASTLWQLGGGTAIVHP